MNIDLPTTQPLVSVIIPAYNHESYVQDAIKSIICQSYKNIELHVIDDGSKDGTYGKIGEIADLCRDRFVHFTLQHQENCGTCVTLIRLLEQVKGKYVYPIASDDMAKCGAVKKLVEFLENNKEYCLAVGDNLLIDRDSKICYWDRMKRLVYDKNRACWTTFAAYLMHGHKIDFASDAFGSYAKLAKGNHVPNGYLIRKSALDSIEKFTTDAPLEDWYMMLQLAKRYKFKFFDTPLYLYRQHSSSTSTDRERMLLITEQTWTHEKNTFIIPFDSSNLVPDGDTFIDKSNPEKRYRASFVKFCQQE